MNRRQKQELMRLAGGNLHFDCPMSAYTTYRVGGPCDALFEAPDETSLKRVVNYIKTQEIPFLVIGRGSNLLVRDGGMEGLVILLKEAFTDIQEQGENLLAGAGLSLWDLLIYCREKGLSGLEWSAGIPGTVGGAVIMNAGAHGNEFGTRVKEIQGIHADGGTKTLRDSQLRFSYRCLDMGIELVITRVLLNLEKGRGEDIRSRISEYLKKRKETQPLEFPNAGSVFKNPPGHAAGRLIESAGLKGMRIGNAMISERHANFIVNMGGATARDILDLIRSARVAVREKTGIELEPEIRIVGR